MGRFHYVQDVLDDSASLGADYTSPSVDCRHLSSLGFNVVATGTPTGDFIVQWSNDNETFRDLQNGSSTTSLSLSGSADTLQFDLTNFSYGYLRLFYDRTSGTGSAEIIYTAKSVG